MTNQMNGDGPPTSDIVLMVRKMMMIIPVNPGCPVIRQHNSGLNQPFACSSVSLPSDVSVNAQKNVLTSFLFFF